MSGTEMQGKVVCLSFALNQPSNFVNKINSNNISSQILNRHNMHLIRDMPDIWEVIWPMLDL